MPWSQSELTQVIQRFAPLVHFHPTETFLPSSVEWYLARSVLLSSNGLKLLHPTMDALPQSSPPSEWNHSILRTGEVLNVGEYLVSPRGKFFLVMQGDGNLVIYRGSGPGDQHEFIWGSVQAGHYTPAAGSYFAVMQSDGNFCIYKGTPGDNHGFVFGTVQAGGYAPQSGAYFAAIRDDGNFGVYRGADPTPTPTEVWSTDITYWLDIDPNWQTDVSGDPKRSVLKTHETLSSGQYLVSQRRRYFLAMQADGNLCVYRGSGPEDNQGFVWGSVQRGDYQPHSGEYFTVMQGDGNLCIYTGRPPGSGGTFVFGTVQDGHYEPESGEYFAVIQDDGNFCVYRGTPKDNLGLMWASGPDQSGQAVQHGNLDIDPNRQTDVSGDPKSFLKNNETLTIGQYLVSEHKLYFLIMQGDGNLCVYRGSGPADNQGFVWGTAQDSHYQPHIGEYFTIMQGDGNLCVYRGSGPADNHGMLWGSVQQWHYPPQIGECVAVMQDDGHVGVYGAPPKDKLGLMWASGPDQSGQAVQHGNLDIDPNRQTDVSGDPKSVLKTNETLTIGQYLVSEHKLYFLIMQGDGNLCVYRGSGPADNQGFVWGTVQDSHYQPHIGEYFTIMQGDGNLCVYRGSGPADNHGMLWGSVQQWHYPPQIGECVAVMQDDGSVGIYGRPPKDKLGLMWASGPDQSGQAVQHGNLASAKPYVHARAEADYVDLQFFFFSPYNGAGTAHLSLIGSENADLSPLGQHVGDWEYVVLRIDSGSKALRSVYLSQHAGGEWITDLSTLERHNEQVVFYASKNGHAAYPHHGDNPSERQTMNLEFATFDFYLVNATAAGPSLDCAARYQLIAADFLEVKQPAWLDFPYRWGPNENQELSVSKAVEIAIQALKGLAGWSLPLLLPVLPALVGLITAALVGFAKMDESGPTGPKQKGVWTGHE